MKVFKFFMLLVACCCVISCEKKVPLDKASFTELLVKIHLTDAIIEDTKVLKNQGDKKNYAYYGEVFNQFGISRDDFDSCVSYYSRQTDVFDKIYADVLDSLNMRLTVINKRLAKLRKNDSVNILTVPDTIRFSREKLDTTIVMKNLAQGKYFFELSLKFDSVDAGKNNKIVSYLLRTNSRDTIFYVDSLWYEPSFIRLDSIVGIDSVYEKPGTFREHIIKRDSLFNYHARRDSFLVKQRMTTIDTIQFRNIRLSLDTAERKYNWSNFIDTSFNTLVIKFVVSDNSDTLSYREAYATQVGLYKRYINDDNRDELKRDFQRRVKNIALIGKDILISDKVSILVADSLKNDSIK